MRSTYALSTSSARSARRLSLPTLSAPSSLSGYLLTHAKHENGVKRAFEDKKPFLRLKLEKSSIRLIRNVESRTEAQKQSKEAKNLSFQEDFRFRSNF